MTVPINKTIIVVGAIVASGGALFTLAHNQGDNGSNSKSNTESIEDANQSNVQGVVENPPVNVEVDGQNIPVGQGRTVLPTKNGQAIVDVDGARVDVKHEAHGQPTGSVDVNIRSQSSNGSQSFSSESRSSSSSSSSSSVRSKVRVSSDGDGTVNIQSNQR